MRRPRVIVLGLILAIGLAHDAVAQRPAQRRTPQRIDSLTASISGKVTTADSGAPIRGAEVRLSVDGRFSRLSTTNGDGRFELRDLPAGEYRLTVSRTGFISTQFGQRRPFEPAATITLAEGASTEANVALTRGGVVYGRVLDTYNEPLAGTRVQVLRSRVVQGRRRLQAVGVADQTDDTGAFRLYGLPPGEYYVAAAAGLGDQAKRDPPTYFPGTANFAEAQSITLAAGAEASADFQLAPIRNARVSGIVVNSSGNPVTAMVNLTSETVSIGPAMEGTVAALAVHADAGPDGRFTLENVPPGPYSLTAMLQMVNFGSDGVLNIGSGGVANSGPPTVADMVKRVPETGVMTLSVTGEDVSGLTIVTRRPAILNGAFVADSGVSRPLPRNLRVTQRAISTAGGISMTMGNGGGSGFQLVGMTGPFVLSAVGVPDGWTVKRMLLNGRDVIDEPIDLNGQNGTLEIVMSDRPSSVIGTVQSRGGPLDRAVVIFPDDASKWTFPSRYVKTTRADADGRFLVRDLPAGERYLAAAIDYLEDGDQDDPDFLDRLRSRATSFALGDNEQHPLQLDAISR